MTYVLAIGLDHGVTDKLRLTLQFPVMQVQISLTGTSGGGGGGSSSAGSGYTTITMDVPGFFTGMNMINSAMPRKLNFMHTKLIVFSEELAKSGDMGEYLAPLVRWRQIRRTAHVIVSRGLAKDFLALNKPFVGETLSKTIELMMNEADNTGLFSHETLNDLYDGIKSTYRQAVTILGSVNNFKELKEDESNLKAQFKKWRRVLCWSASKARRKWH